MSKDDFSLVYILVVLIVLLILLFTVLQIRKDVDRLYDIHTAQTPAQEGK